MSDFGGFIDVSRSLAQGRKLGREINVLEKGLSLHFVRSYMRALIGSGTLTYVYDQSRESCRNGLMRRAHKKS